LYAGEPVNMVPRVAGCIRVERCPVVFLGSGCACRHVERATRGAPPRAPPGDFSTRFRLRLPHTPTLSASRPSPRACAPPPQGRFALLHATRARAVAHPPHYLGPLHGLVCLHPSAGCRYWVSKADMLPAVRTRHAFSPPALPHLIDSTPAATSMDAARWHRTGPPGYRAAYGSSPMVYYIYNALALLADVGYSGLFHHLPPNELTQHFPRAALPPPPLRLAFYLSTSHAASPFCYMAYTRIWLTWLWAWDVP